MMRCNAYHIREGRSIGRLLHGKTLSRAAIIVVVTAVVVLMAAAEAAGQCLYEVESLIIPPVGGGGGVPYTPHNDANDISDTGVVVGWYEQCGFTGRRHPFMWSQQTGFVQLERPPGYTTIEATGVSPSGRYIVG